MEKYSHYELTAEEIRFLMEYQFNPLISLEEISENTKIPLKMVKKIENKFLGDSKIKNFYNVKAIPHLHGIGLEIVIVFCEIFKHDQITNIKGKIKQIPIISYFADCYGTLNGLFTVFYIPPKNIKKLENKFKKMKILNEIHQYLLLRFDQQPIYTQPIRKHWNIKNNSWEFSWKDWYSEEGSIQTLKSSLSKSSKSYASFRENKLWLKPLDLFLLSEFMSDYSQSYSSLLQKVQKLFTAYPQNLERRIKLVKLNLIKLVITESHQLFNNYLIPVIFWGNGLKQDLNELREKLQRKTFPFFSIYYFDDYTFFWQIHISKMNLNQIISELTKISDEIKYFFFDITSLRNFSIDFKNYNEINQNWIDLH